MLVARGVDAIGLGRHDARVDDPAALAKAFAGATVVIDAAGPLRDTAEPVLLAALAAGAHYLDVGGEQAVLHRLHERHESTARKAGLVALPGAGLDGLLGDLAIAWAAQHLTDAVDFGAVTRGEPGERLAEDAPLDEACTSYLYRDLALSAGMQRALFGAIGARPRVWRRDRWEEARGGERRRVNAGHELGERDAVGYGGGDAITVPRHVAANLVATYVSTTARPLASRALGLLARAASFVPASASELLAPYAATPDACARTRFAVVAQVRRGFAQAQLVVRGGDPTRTTGAIAAWCALAIAARDHGPIGMRAPGELFRAEGALRELATLCDLTIEPSFA